VDQARNIDGVDARLIKLFITGDDPRSLRTVELDNWCGSWP
jgi:hypothetical protein